MVHKNAADLIFICEGGTCQRFDGFPIMLLSPAMLDDISQ